MNTSTANAYLVTGIAYAPCDLPVATRIAAVLRSQGVCVSMLDNPTTMSPVAWERDVLSTLGCILVVCTREAARDTVVLGMIDRASPRGFGVGGHHTKVVSITVGDGFFGDGSTFDRHYGAFPPRSSVLAARRPPPAWPLSAADLARVLASLRT